MKKRCKELDLIRYNLGEFSDRSKIDLLTDEDILYSTELSLLMAISNHVKLRHIGVEDYSKEYQKIFGLFLEGRNKIIHGGNDIVSYMKYMRDIFEYIIEYIPYNEYASGLLDVYQL